MNQRLEMLSSRIESDFLGYLFEKEVQPGDRLPPLNDISAEMGISVGKLREQLEVARMLGLIDASPRRGILCNAYDFRPAVRLSLLTAIAFDRKNFDAFSSLRVHLESAYWDEAVQSLTSEDKAQLCQLVADAKDKLSLPRITIPHHEHRELHMTILRRLENPFVIGLLNAYWDAYEAVELNTYADYAYLQEVWCYHERIVKAICDGDFAVGKQLLVEHMQLLSSHGISMEARILEQG